MKQLREPVGPIPKETKEAFDASCLGGFVQMGTRDPGIKTEEPMRVMQGFSTTLRPRLCKAVGLPKPSLENTGYGSFIYFLAEIMVPHTTLTPRPTRSR